MKSQHYSDNFDRVLSFPSFLKIKYESVVCYRSHSYGIALKTASKVPRL